MQPETPEPKEPPVEPHEFLLRHFASDPGEYDFTKKFPRREIFRPRSSDKTGLSLNREGPPTYPTAEEFLASANNVNTRAYGGVVAVVAAGVTNLGLTLKITKGDLPGHVEIEQLTIGAYQENPQQIKDILDKLIRLVAAQPPQLEMRIHPKPRPPKGQ